MNNNTKHKYIPCEVKLVEFNVERGFATTGLTAGDGKPAFPMQWIAPGQFKSWTDERTGMSGAETEQMHYNFYQENQAL